MPESPLQAAPRLTKTRFVIAVPDLKVSSQFYREVLGFTIHAIPDPGWLFYERENCLIMAGQCRDALAPAELGDHAYFAYFEFDEVDSLYEDVRSSGAKICKPMRDEPWGMREFGVVTADGHRIMIGSPIQKKRQP